ncbi:endolytic transglycosylase MltG [Kocuria sp. CPCC 205292]|uniref:endolytic transglycosylase MltG n=1 Tax=Kocuria cellulosilytica TaxID=3071451 RepID=UPI0034D4AE2C
MSDDPYDQSASRRPEGARESSGGGGGLGSLLDAPSSRQPSTGLRGVFEHEELTPEQVKRRQRRGRVSLTTAIALFLLAALITVSVLGSTFGWFEIRDYRGDGKDPVTFSVAQGATTGQIAVALQEQGIVADAETFVETYQEEHAEQFIQPGEYELRTEMSSEAAVDALMEEDEATHYAAVNRTLRMSDVFGVLSESTGIPVSEFEAYEEDTEAFGIPGRFPTLEGWLHPGEYRFPLDATAEQILRDMVDRTRATLEDNGVSGEDRIFEVLTIGSIIEFEVQPEHYDVVAGAIQNRLDNPDGETSGFIQSDASVTYGLDRRSYDFTEEERRDESNRYNTFANPGLPVGPIGSPGDAAIAAAADPQENDYYFWVTVNLDTGETKFSETYAQHLEYVEEYNQWCSENEGRCG